MVKTILWRITQAPKDAKKIAEWKHRVGFRTIKMDGKRMLINGKPIKLRGANRHDVHPTLGRTATPELDRKDAELFKRANLNFVRTSHYPTTLDFIRACDEIGLYVENESAVCFQRPPSAPSQYRCIAAMANKIATVTTAVAQGNLVTLGDLPPEFREISPRVPDFSPEAPVMAPRRRMTMSEERQAILDALESAGGHVGRAAETLGMSRPTFWRRRKKHQI